MAVNEALQSPPSSPYSGAVIPPGITGRAIETHYRRNLIASEGCKLQGKWMEHTGGRGGGGGGEVQPLYSLTHVISF